MEHRIPVGAVALATGIILAGTTLFTPAGGSRSEAPSDDRPVVELKRLEHVAHRTPVTTTTTTEPRKPRARRSAPTATAPTPPPAPAAKKKAVAPAAPAPVAPPPPPSSSTRRDTACEADFARWMNEARAANGVGPLAVDGAIVHVPLNWSTGMAERGSLSHNPNYASQIYAARPEARAVAENVGYASSGGRTVFDRFMGSSGHRSNILNGTYSHAATGCVVDAGGTTWVTVNFWG